MLNWNSWLFSSRRQAHFLLEHHRVDYLMGWVSAFVEHLGISVRRTVKFIWIECAGKMEGAFRRLEFSPRVAKSLGWRVVGWGLLVCTLTAFSKGFA